MINTFSAWVSISTTDRPNEVRELFDQLVLLRDEAHCDLTLLLHENSRSVTARQAVRHSVTSLVERGVHVVLACENDGGASIATSREQQREMIRQRLDSTEAPSFIWMLDDDILFTHLLWTGQCLASQTLHNHFLFLHQMAKSFPDLGMLIGQVTGDPPIPVVATLASRLVDLETNLVRMLGLPRDDVWQIPSDTITRVAEHDAYYDFSTERTLPTWANPIAWLPRSPNETVGDTLQSMLKDAEGIPCGIGFTRPILANPSEFCTLKAGVRRGGNTVFFRPELCLKHQYPSTKIANVETRRGDMIGAALLAAKSNDSIRTSSFSVMHRRSRALRWPSRVELSQTLVADMLGAALAREVESRLGGRGVGDFLLRRLQAVRQAFGVVIQTAARLRGVLRSQRAAGYDVRGVCNVLDWLTEALPCLPDGRLLPDAEEILSSMGTSRHLSRCAEQYVQEYVR